MKFSKARFITLHSIMDKSKYPLIRILLLATLLLAPLALLHANESPKNKPNIVILLADDQGWGDLSINGNTQIETPNVDRIAREGARFDRFFVSPVCAPTRAEFLTGRQHARCGVWGVSEGGERINTDEKTMADIFKVAGYKTAAFGKWHNGAQFPYHPNARGFDEFYGFCSGHWGNYFSPVLDHNGRLVKGNGYIINDLTDHALQFMEAHRQEPFFVYLPYNTPHAPMQVPDQWWNKFKDKPLPLPHRYQDKEDVNFTRAALAMCENIDSNVARVLEKLDELKVADNTIVVYFSDNGPNSYRWNGGMRGKKGWTDEGGVRVPLLIRWPGHIQPGTEVRQISCAMDLLPTLAGLANVPLTGTKPLDGLSFKSQLLGGKEMMTDRMIFSHWNKKVSVRTQQYRLDDQGCLYDMVADPGQESDITAQQPAIAAILRKAVADWKMEMLPALFDDKRPFVIGHPSEQSTMMDAADGVAHGNIQRSNRWANDSFFTNWKHLEDSIIWDCEVGQSGEYLADIYYTCPAADVGSTVEISFNGSKLSGKVEQPNDPPLVGKEQDRVEREESYVKDFEAMTLGKIWLEKGRGTLKLQALEIPGSQVMDIRRIVLTRTMK
jgi:arylsulfatase A-like enzyme